MVHPNDVRKSNRNGEQKRCRQVFCSIIMNGWVESSKYERNNWPCVVRVVNGFVLYFIFFFYRFFLCVPKVFFSTTLIFVATRRTKVMCKRGSLYLLFIVCWKRKRSGLMNDFLHSFLIFIVIGGISYGGCQGQLRRSLSHIFLFSFCSPPCTLLRNEYIWERGARQCENNH